MNLMKSIIAMVLGGMFMSVNVNAETAKINGGEIYYETKGEGPPLLLMHGGLGLDHTYFKPFLNALEKDYTVIYYDHFGNGRSSYPADFKELTIERLVSDASELIKHLGYEKVVLFGHSYGGFIGQEFAIKHGDQLDKLILANTVPVLNYAPTLKGDETQMAALGKLFTKPVADDADFAATWNIVSQMYYKNYDPKIGAELDKNTKYSYQAWNAASGLLANFNTTERLGEISVKTLVISGKYDGITPNEHGGKVFDEKIKNSDLVVFENSGHFPFIEETEAFSKAVMEWLAK